MSKVYFDESEGWQQGIRIELRDSGQIVIEQYDTFDGKATDTVVFFVVGEAERIAEAILEAVRDDNKRTQALLEREKVRRLERGEGLPGGY